MVLKHKICNSGASVGGGGRYLLVFPIPDELVREAYGARAAQAIRVAQGLPFLPASNRARIAQRSRKVTVGYLSADLSNHPVDPHSLPMATWKWSAPHMCRCNGAHPVAMERPTHAGRVLLHWSAPHTQAEERTTLHWSASPSCNGASPHMPASAPGPKSRCRYQALIAAGKMTSDSPHTCIAPPLTSISAHRAPTP